MANSETETDQEKLVKLQNYLADASGADISEVRRAFNDANDAQYYHDKFDRTAYGIGIAGLFGVCAGVGSLIGIANSNMTVAVCFGLATFGMYACAKSSVRAQQKVREEIREKVAAAPKAPEV